jgi:hypothetical protein
MPERAAGWMGQARRVSHCGGTLRPRAEQQTKRRPHDELCANQGDSEFPQDYRGKPSPGAYRSMKATLLSVHQKQIVLAEVAASIIVVWQAAVRGAFRFQCPRSAPPSATIRHLHDQRVRRQGDTL